MVSRTSHVITFTFFGVLTFFLQNLKKRDFLHFFALLHTFSRTMAVARIISILKRRDFEARRAESGGGFLGEGLHVPRQLGGL